MHTFDLAANRLSMIESLDRDILHWQSVGLDMSSRVRIRMPAIHASYRGYLKDAQIYWLQLVMTHCKFIQRVKETR